MSNKSLSELKSYINDASGAKDNERVFTFIEFVKDFGYDNSSEVFLEYYREYLTLWNNKKKGDIKKSDDDFVLEKMTNILKSITLDYSSYEEQDFIAHIDWSNKDHIRAMISYYSRKIREITEFYRKKRNESHLIIKRNSMKGSTKSLEEVIYNKIIDFVFNNRNIIPSYTNIRRDLIVSVENYVDTYSEYFDIPRNEKFSDRSRKEMLSANMNDIDYRDYLEISLVVSEILFTGNVYLEEIPLIAQLGLDLSQSCVGDMLALKDTLVNNTTINQIPLTEQVALKRKLYEKYLGCDLYYLYVDLQKNIKIDTLCKASNPTGNLLNCGSVDTATIESGQLELLSHIGLFFKPDKTSILKISAKDFTWSVDESKLEEDTIYIFPDPSKYGDIGNNKSNTYPLVMEYKMDYDIRNLSSGESTNDPLLFITDQGWRSYYSKQEDDFKLIDNINYEYAFTDLVERGIITSYQTDVWGNQFGLFKGYEVIYKKDENDDLIFDINGEPIIEKIQVPSKFEQKIDYVDTIYNTSHPMILNGGYFEDPYHKGTVRTKKKTYYSDKEDYVNLVVPSMWKKDDNNNDIFRYTKLLSDVYHGEYYKYNEKGEYEKNPDIYELDRKGEIVYDVCGKPKFAAHYFMRSPKRKYVPDYEIETYRKIDGNIISKFYEEHTEIETGYGYLSYNDGGYPFDHTKKQTINDNYHWTGLKVNNPYFYIPTKIYNHINYGEFGKSRNIEYVDNYEVIKRGTSSSSDITDDKIDTLLSGFVSSLIKTDGSDDSVKIEGVEKNIEDLSSEIGTLYIRNTSSVENKPEKFCDCFSWMKNIIDDEKIINIQVIFETIVIETEDKIYFIKYIYDGENFTNPLINQEIIYVTKNDYLSTSYVLLEKEKCFYIAQLELNERVKSLNLHISKFDCVNYNIEEVINFYDVINKTVYEEKRLNTKKTWRSFIDAKNEINKENNLEKLDLLLRGLNEDYPNLGDFSIPFMMEYDLGNVCFTYNSSLKLFLISFIIMDANGTPFLYEYKFKLTNIDVFHGTLVSNLYSMGGSNNKGEDVESRYMETLTSNSVCFPDESITSPIFEVTSNQISYSMRGFGFKNITRDDYRPETLVLRGHKRIG